jgi:hypothetical protein
MTKWWFPFSMTWFPFSIAIIITDHNVGGGGRSDALWISSRHETINLIISVRLRLLHHAWWMEMEKI